MWKKSERRRTVDCQQVEAALIRYVNLPVGTSLIAVGQKPE